MTTQSRVGISKETHHGRSEKVHRAEDYEDQLLRSLRLLFLFLRMVDWLWDAIPDWLFFLLMGGMAFGTLLVLRSVRERGRTT